MGNKRDLVNSSNDAAAPYLSTFMLSWKPGLQAGRDGVGVGVGWGLGRSTKCLHQFSVETRVIMIQSSSVQTGPGRHRKDPQVLQL